MCGQPNTEDVVVVPLGPTFPCNPTLLVYSWPLRSRSLGFEGDQDCLGGYSCRRGAQ